MVATATIAAMKPILAFLLLHPASPTLSFLFIYTRATAFPATPASKAKSARQRAAVRASLSPLDAVVA
jgi:hypothetical protein